MFWGGKIGIKKCKYGRKLDLQGQKQIGFGKVDSKKLLDWVKLDRKCRLVRKSEKKFWTRREGEVQWCKVG